MEVFVMSKPNEVLFRLHNVTPPAALQVEEFDRNDIAFEVEHARLGVLPGEKIFKTNVDVDGPWMLAAVFNVLKRNGYTPLNMNVERRPTPKMTIKPVLSINFGLTGETTCTPEQVNWAEEFLSTVVFKLAHGYLNPRVDGSSQLAIDCIFTVKREPGQSDLPLQKMLGAPAPTPDTTALA